jgi:Fur family ferric uptake transcriptional regulator
LHLAGVSKSKKRGNTLVIIIVTSTEIMPELMQRTTKQRRVILEELAKLKTHPTADEVYEAVRRRLPHVSLGTVYRNLDVLARSGAVTRMAPSEAPCRFDASISPHYHVTCTECGRVDDVWDLPDHVPIETPARLSGYEVAGHRLEFIGVCPECQAKRMYGGMENG